MSFKDSAKGVATALRLDSHHAIERFGVFFGALVLTSVLIFSGASVSAVTNVNAQMDSRTLYTPSFATSKTQLAGDVDGVFVNSDRTRAMVLMRFKDASSVSANAQKYQAFLTGSSVDLVDQALKTDITGQIVVFGSTGYMAMVLDSSGPFQQQILNLTMRANSELVYKPSEQRKVREDLKGQSTFSEFDQWRLFFNPGASGATKSEALDAPTFDAGAVYSELVVASEEKTIRAAMDEELNVMRADLARIGEYEAESRRVSVDGVFLTAPVAPAQIAGDVVTGEPGIGDTESTLALETEWVSPRGYDFDWRAGSVTKGYLGDLVDEGESYVTYLADKASAGKDADSQGVRVNDIEWQLSNGRLLKDYGTSDRAMQPLFEIRNGLSQAYQDYYKHKLDYQTKSYTDLLDLEVGLLNVRAGASNNSSQKALFTY
ncbi:hypothetical protein SAMN06295974_3698 [Plantibacter flavus]|uniref:Uncharacterized protein n=1 Tax=Plantibacter flavus TaxID=150123 RepID=A0A3N2BL02_9MICO|nr:hypothetical protein [Plantibacter flavus]ROR75967.1 hypothetical protein EDD42_3918 [Plantibacter flavus]SMG48228.1 hypothetical protein SAMN06295974_3698 [Plantibacter flavus]